MKASVHHESIQKLWLSADTKLARDVMTKAAYFWPWREMVKGRSIHGFGHLENVKVAARASIGLMHG